MRLVISGRRRVPATLLAAAALRVLALGLAGAFLSSTDARHHLVAPALADEGGHGKGNGNGNGGGNGNSQGNGNGGGNQGSGASNGGSQGNGNSQGNGGTQGSGASNGGSQGNGNSQGNGGSQGSGASNGNGNSQGNGGGNGNSQGNGNGGGNQGSGASNGGSQGNGASNGNSQGNGGGNGNSQGNGGSQGSGASNGNGNSQGNGGGNGNSQGNGNGGGNQGSDASNGGSQGNGNSQGNGGNQGSGASNGGSQGNGASNGNSQGNGGGNGNSQGNGGSQGSGASNGNGNSQGNGGTQGSGASNGGSQGNGNSQGNGGSQGSGASNGNGNSQGNGGGNGNSQGNGNGGGNQGSGASNGGSQGNGASNGNSQGNGGGNGNSQGNGGSQGSGASNGNGNSQGNGGGNGNSQGNGNGGGNQGSDANNGNGQGNAGGSQGSGASNGSSQGNDNGNSDGSQESGAGASGISSSAGSSRAPAGVTNPGREGRGGFEPGEVVVLGGSSETLARVRRLGFRLIEARPFAALGLSALKLSTPTGLDARQGVALLHARYPDLTADVNNLYGTYETEAAQVVSLPAPDYARRMIRWSGGEGCGAGLRIGMIDSALAAGLPTFADRKLHQRSFVEPGHAAADPAHGTAIAALLVGVADPAHLTAGGLLPDADLYAAAVFERQGGQSQASAFAIAAALDWMVQNRVAVVNISLAGDNNALMALAVHRASERGTILVAAAGNAGPDAPPAYPGALPEVIAVTAVDQTGAVFPEANRGDYIAFAAPGVRIWVPSPDGQGHYQTGTSFAAPFALGTAALEVMRGAPPNAEALRRRLAAKAHALGTGGKNPVFGYGLVQAGASCGVVALAE